MKKLFAFYQFLMLNIFLPLITCLIYCPLISICLVIKAYKTVGILIQNWGWLCIFLLQCKYSIEGLEHFNQKKRYLIVCNHGSMMDIPFTAILTPIPISWVLKAELLRIPIANIMFKLGVGIPISRDNAKEAQEKILYRVQTLRNNLNPNILIYPEGTRSKTGNINPFKRGFVQVMRNYELDILPITLSGIVGFYSNVQKFPNPDATIKVTIHPVESYEKLKDFTDKEITSKLQDIISSTYFAKDRIGDDVIK